MRSLRIWIVLSWVALSCTLRQVRSTRREHEKLVRACGRRRGGFHYLEELFYSKVLADSILKTERLPHLVDHLTWFTAESFGGPDRFARELGFNTSSTSIGI